jgi:hypothetical protein
MGLVMSSTRVSGVAPGAGTGTGQACLKGTPVLAHGQRVFDAVAADPIMQHTRPGATQDSAAPS